MTASENRAVKPTEKTDKRRALGRGLESLLPGPRVVVPSTEVRVPSGYATGAAPAVDNPEMDADAHGQPSPQRPIEIQAVVDPEFHEGAEAGDVTSSATPGPPSTITLMAQAEPGRVPSNLVTNLPLESIQKNPFQTRYVFDNDLLNELADSIQKNGVVQPVVVRPAEEEGKYVLILGERRLRASKMAGKETIPAIVRRVSEQQAAEMTVIENLQRQDLNCLEQAEAFRVLSQKFGMTQAEIGERTGVSRETVSNYMRLLRLPKQVMGYMLEDRLNFTDARLILSLDNDDQIEEVAKEVVEKHLKWDEIEALVMRKQGFLPPAPGETKKESRGSRWQDPNVRVAQTELERMLGLRVRIRDRKGKGEIVIQYATVDDYDRVVEMLKGKR
jgi:ParB family chromosome partitioning protein